MSTLHRKLSRRVILSVAALSAALLASPVTIAAEFPNKPIRLVVPFVPGSGTDVSARHIARYLQEVAGQPVIVENKPGANSVIGIQHVLAAEPDGHTIFFGGISPMAVNTVLFKSLPYDPVKDFAPLAVIYRTPVLLIVPGNSPYQTLEDLVKDARQQARPLHYGAGGAAYQLTAEMFNENMGIRTEYVPFKGAGEVVTAVAGGVVAMGFVDVVTATELIKAGRVRALGVSDQKRSPLLPDVPTIREASGGVDFDVHFWSAAFMASKVPEERIKTMSELFRKVMELPETRTAFAQMGGEPMEGDVHQARQYQLREIERWKGVAERAGIEAQ